MLQRFTYLKFQGHFPWNLSERPYNGPLPPTPLLNYILATALCYDT